MNSLNPTPVTTPVVPLVDNEEISREEQQAALGGCPSIAAFFNKVTDDFLAQDRANSERQTQKRRTVSYREYSKSNHDGDIVDGKFEDLSDVGDDYFYDPKLNTYDKSRLPILLQAQTRFLVTPKHSTEIKYKRVADFLKKEYETWLAKHRTINKRQRELRWNLFAAGDTYRYLYLNEKKIAQMIKIPTVTEKQVETSTTGTWTCPNCGANGALSDLDMQEREETSAICPQCQFQGVPIKPSVQVKINDVEGFENQPMAELDFDVPDANKVTVIWTDDEIENALAVIYERDIPRCVLEEAFPGKTIPKSNQYSDEKPYLSENPAEIDTGTDLVRTEFIWLNPSVYARQKTDKAEIIQVGDQVITLPMNQAVIGELFPTGCHLVRAGGKSILQTYEQAIGDCWTHTVNEISDGGYGVGEWDLLQLQFQKNEMRTQRMQKTLKDSTQPIINVGGHVVDFPNEHGAIINIPDTGDKKWNEIIGRIPASNFPVEATELEQQIDGDMQAAAGAMSTGTGDMPDMKAIQGTATGYQEYIKHTTERRRPMLEMMAENLDKKMFYQFWKANKDYYSKAALQQYFDKIPDEVIEWFFEMDIATEFEVSVVPNSYMPETLDEKRIRLANWWQIAAPIVSTDPMKLQAVEREFAEVFGGVDFDERSEEQTEAQLRLDKILKAAKKVELTQKGQGLGTADVNGFVSAELITTALQQATKITKTLQDINDPLPDYPIDVLLDEHEEFIDVYQDYLRSAPGRQLSQFCRAVLKQLIVVHSQAAPMKEIYIQSLFAQVEQAQQQRQLEQMQQAAGVQMEIQNDQMMLEQADEQMRNAAELEHAQAAHDQEMGHDLEKKEQDLAFEGVRQLIKE